ncbi:MAG: hypothetical protein HQL08_11180 [Nitrospirae bacterium]|nr:hypothetical protein [Nitrospirota bacterium]
MEAPASKNIRFFHYSTYLIAAVLLSLYFTNMHFMFCTEAKRASLSMLLQNTADVPTQYRVLIPWTVNLLMGLKLPFHASPERIFEAIEFLSAFFLLIAFRLYISFFIKNSLLSSLLSFAVFIILPYQYIFYSRSFGAIYYPYDIPSVLFFTLGLVLIYKKNWSLYYPFFIIATFNRETTIFLTFICLVTAIEKNGKITLLIHCVAQLLIWAIIKKFLAVLYAGNAGPGFFVNFFFVNLSLITHPVNAVRVASSFGFIWIGVIYYFKLITDVFVKRTLLVIFPFLIGMFIVGNVMELRIYGELIPVILSAFLLIVNHFLHTEEGPEPPTRGANKT